jgi:acetyl esterase/lipase
MNQFLPTGALSPIKWRMAMLIRAILIAMAISASGCAAIQPPSLPEVTDKVARVDRYPVRDVAFPNGVRGIPDAVYWTPVGYRPLTLDLYLPPDSVERPATGFPLVVFIHGGGWLIGDKHRSGPFVDFPGVLASLSAKGYVVASIEYRFSSEARFPAQARDVKAAIRWLRLNASKYGIDPARAVTWGESAGAHLAALAAVSCCAAALEPGQAIKMAPGTPDISSADVSDCVQGGVAWFGVFDIATITEQARKAKAFSRDVPEAPEWQLLGCFANECKPEQIAAASPVSYVDRNDPPMSLIVGTEDTTVPY